MTPGTTTALDRVRRDLDESMKNMDDLRAAVKFYTNPDTYLLRAIESLTRAVATLADAVEREARA